MESGSTTSKESVLYFDGMCNLCNGFVDFMIRRSRHIQFAPLQGPTAKERLPEEVTLHMNSLVFQQGSRIRTESSGAIYAIAQLGGLWTLALGLLLVPPFLRNGVYGFIARNRYKHFGKRSTCRIPTEAEKTRFLP